MNWPEFRSDYSGYKKWKQNTFDNTFSTRSPRLPIVDCQATAACGGDPRVESDCQPVQSTQIIMFTFHGRLHPRQTSNSTSGNFALFHFALCTLLHNFFSHFFVFDALFDKCSSIYIFVREMKLKEKLKWIKDSL